jgi:uncharacterized membrane protein
MKSLTKSRYIGRVKNSFLWMILTLILVIITETTIFPVLAQQHYNVINGSNQVVALLRDFVLIGAMVMLIIIMYLVLTILVYFMKTNNISIKLIDFHSKESQESKKKNNTEGNNDLTYQSSNPNQNPDDEDKIIADIVMQSHFDSQDVINPNPIDQETSLTSTFSELLSGLIEKINNQDKSIEKLIDEVSAIKTLINDQTNEITKSANLIHDQTNEITKSANLIHDQTNEIKQNHQSLVELVNSQRNESAQNHQFLEGLINKITESDKHNTVTTNQVNQDQFCKAIVKVFSEYQQNPTQDDIYKKLEALNLGKVQALSARKLADKYYLESGSEDLKLYYAIQYDSVNWYLIYDPSKLENINKYLQDALSSLKIITSK